VREWDDPEEIVEGCIREQMRLISGYKGSMETDIKKIEEAKKPKHVAISLIGEPTLYPFLPELISAFHKRGMTTFLVTNGTFPEALEDVDPSQLYLSLNAPDEETYKRVCNANHWERIKRSLFMLKDKNRTAIRITLIEGMNIKEPESYGKLIEMVEPVFIEVKAYMHLGFSRERLSRGAMPPHDRVRGFAIELASLINYEIADESEISRVVLLSRDGKINPIIA
jgi:tRNA wybutosine-synthesizing protein 1